MNIAITLVHNKTPQENEAQVEALKNLLITVPVEHEIHDEKGNVVESYIIYHHELKELDIPHKIKIYQAVPFGMTPPSNRYEINSGGIVEYRGGDEDKVGQHPRFFNWGAKRGFDQGADVSIYLEDVDRLNVKSLKARLESKTDFSEDNFGKMISKDEFRRGQLREDRGLNEAVSQKRRARNG